MRSLELNIAGLAARKTGEAAARPASPCQRHARTRADLRDATAPRLIDGWRRLSRCRRRAVEWHPVNGVQYGKPNFPVLDVLIGVLFEQRDRRDLAAMLPA